METAAGVTAGSAGAALLRRHLVTRPLGWGVAGAVILAVVYTGILTLANSLEHAWQQYLYLWPWMTPLVLGFGVQVGLFGYMLGFRVLSEASAAGTATVAATTGISSAAMIACCLHHVTDVLPILGFSAAAAFLGTYQDVFLAIGVVSNAIGIAFMLRTIKVHHLHPAAGAMATAARLPLKGVFVATVGLGLAAVAFVVYRSLWS